MSNTENVKYQQIMQSAHELFMKHGMRKITIEEICKTANVSKVTFYKFFKNKLDVSKKVLDLIMEHGFQIYADIMAQAIPYREKVEKILAFKLKAARDMGDEFIKELVEADEDMKAYLIEIRQKNMKAMMDMLEQGKKEGVIRGDLDPEFYVFMLSHINVMIEDPKLKKIFPDPRKRAEELVKFWFYGMFDAIG
jgi:AcrR family transcriptional regulator